ncbi:MAG: MGMT family protein [Anaerolineales bacterium]|nr:MGMT family protein [Anaerolineales bacterium]
MSPFASPPDPIIFNNQVWEIVRQVPPGKVTTYGQIAKMIPPPGDVPQRSYDAFGPRWVGGAMAASPDDVPWQRVINSQGKISLRPGVEDQRRLLEEEDVEFNEKGKVDFERFGWNGPDPAWCKERGFLVPPPLSKGQARLF